MTNQEISIQDVVKTIAECGITLKDLNEHLCVSTPGKFENEHISTLYFYSALMNGDGETSEYADNSVFFVMTDHERKLFGFLPGYNYFAIYLSDSGFIYGGAHETLPTDITDRLDINSI